MTAKIKLGFVVDASNLRDALQAMAGIALGAPTIMEYYPDAAEFTQQLQVDPDQTPEDGEPFNGPVISARKAGRPGSVLTQALEVLRTAGTKGIGSTDFHDAMIEHGLDRKASHNALFNVKKLGLARQSSNKRIYITREGNARAS